MLIDKVLTFFLDPIGLGLTILAASFIVSWKRLPRIFAWTAISVLLALTLASTPLVANALMRSVERGYPVTSVENCTSADVAILLGGSLRVFEDQATGNRQIAALAPAGDRVRLAHEALKRGKVQAILISGGNVSWSKAKQSEAEHIRDILITWGTNPDRIRLETTSTNTRSNAVGSLAVMQNEGWTTALLVTSASHMRRALATFQKVGVQASACTADPQSTKMSPNLILNWLPSAGWLQMSSTAIKETAGYIVYWARGWI